MKQPNASSTRSKLDRMCPCASDICLLHPTQLVPKMVSNPLQLALVFLFHQLHVCMCLCMYVCQVHMLCVKFKVLTAVVMFTPLYAVGTWTRKKSDTRGLRLAVLLDTCWV